MAHIAIVLCIAAAGVVLVLIIDELT